MKKVTSDSSFDFLAKGVIGTPTAVVVKIGPKGAIVDDESAAVIAARFGGLVTITNVDAKEAAKAAKAALAEVETDEENSETVGDEEAPAEEPAKTKGKSK